MSHVLDRLASRETHDLKRFLRSCQDVRDGKIAHVMAKVNTKTHAEDVLGVLKAMA